MPDDELTDERLARLQRTPSPEHLVRGFVYASQILGRGVLEMEVGSGSSFRGERLQSPVSSGRAPGPVFLVVRNLAMGIAARIV